MIAPKAGAAAEAVDVTYTAEALARSGDLAAAAGTASLPVFGLYAGRESAVTVVLTFVDGEVRWVVPEPMNAPSSAYIDNCFIVGAQDSTQFQRIELDGRVSRGSANVPTYTSFHHNIEPGKTGWLAAFNAIDAGDVPQIECIVTEMDASGRLIKD